MSDPKQPEFPPASPAPPSLGEELDELQSSTTVQELEMASSVTAALISETLASTPAPLAGEPDNPPPPPFIDFDRVSITFGDRKVLDEVSFHLGRGQTLCILGRSGVGKSVSLRILLGFLKADSGCVRVDGQDISSLDERGLQEIRKHVTMVFQNGALFDSLTVGENIAFPLREKGGLFEDQIQQLVSRLLDLVGASDTVNLLPSSLSTGQKRCIAIARALAAQPEAILYDEPTTMVDPIMSDILAQLMLKLKHDLKLTAVVVTHDLDLMRRVADKVVVLFEGRAIYFGPVKDLEKSDHPHIRAFLAMDRVELVPGAVE